MADHFVEARFRRFVGRLWAIDRDGGDGAGVNELLDTGVFRRKKKIFCAADVGFVNIFRALRPKTIIRRDVKDALHALHSTLEGSGIAQVAGDILQREIGDSAVVARSAQQHAHDIAARDELASDVAPEETGGTCNQSSHAVGLKPAAQAEFAGLEGHRTILPCFLRLISEASQGIERKRISVQVIF